MAGLLFAGCAAGPSPEAPNPDVTTSSAGDAGLVMHVGECIGSDDNTFATTDSQVIMVSCAEPHFAEVAYETAFVGEIALSNYPGPEALYNAAIELCTLPMADLAAAAVKFVSFGQQVSYPTRSAWASGSRKVHCLAIPPGGPVVGKVTDPVD